MEHNICGQMVSAPFQLPPLLLLPLNLATFDFGLSFSPLPSPPSLRASLVQSHAQRPDPKKPEAPSLRRVLLPVAHPKNIPRLIQPPYCTHQPRAQWFSRPLATTCGSFSSSIAIISFSVLFLYRDIFLSMPRFVSIRELYLHFGGLI